jgi:hypothetical protein
MDVDVGHRLHAVFFAVYHETAAFFGAAPGREKFLRLVQKLSQEGGVFALRVHQRRNVLFGHYQKVYRRLGRNVVEGADFVIFVDLVAGNFPRNDFTKQAVIHGLLSHGHEEGSSAPARQAACE